MNRPIKFRAWDKVDREMLPWEVLKSSPMYLLNEMESRVFQQFTGLLSKDGKEIYEGDIVETEGVSPFLGGKDKPKWMPRKDVVEWKDNGYFPFNEYWPSGSSVMKSRLHPEVIGNIYENPELIK